MITSILSSRIKLADIRYWSMNRDNDSQEEQATFGELQSREFNPKLTASWTYRLARESDSSRFSAQAKTLVIPDEPSSPM